ncbi:hypothetical protein [Solibacillus isronensis]|uniref:hypothetical protein n=1 Tax=Solibacillus isronensis TaxID=412383 RepID=UPI0020415100|nr:hypothetical protein [Solibacillus isronensis]MCM3722540.1 hypothetical protein [Solibacillus isronensis]
MLIVGLPYSTHKISVSTNSLAGGNSLAINLNNGRPGINDGDGGFNLGINVGKKPQFTITFKDEDGNEVETGIFTAERQDGSVLQ